MFDKLIDKGIRYWQFTW